MQLSPTAPTTVTTQQPASSSMSTLYALRDCVERMHADGAYMVDNEIPRLFNTRGIQTATLARQEASANNAEDAATVLQQVGAPSSVVDAARGAAAVARSAQPTAGDVTRAGHEFAGLTEQVRAFTTPLWQGTLRNDPARPIDPTTALATFPDRRAAETELVRVLTKTNDAITMDDMQRLALVQNLPETRRPQLPDTASFGGGFRLAYEGCALPASNLETANYADAARAMVFLATRSGHDALQTRLTGAVPIETSLVQALASTGSIGLRRVGTSTEQFLTASLGFLDARTDDRRLEWADRPAVEQLARFADGVAGTWGRHGDLAERVRTQAEQLLAKTSRVE